MTNLADLLVTETGADRTASAIGITATYQPAGGAGDKIMPPSFPVDGKDRPPYLEEDRWIDGEQRKVVVLDQAQSQANRVEEALRDARDAGRVALPIFEMVVKTSRGPIRLTSLDFPHRYADAYLRDSEIGGVRFDKTGVGQRLRETTVEDVRPLYEREPCSLLYGAWDSHRAGRWPKFARVYTASIIGVEPLLGERAAGRMDPANLTGFVDSKDKARAGGDWQFIQSGGKSKGVKLSEAGLGNIAPGLSNVGGVSVREARRSAWISLSGLERLRFGDAPPEAAGLARATLAALALAGDRLAFGRPSVWLRSGCDLVRTEERLVVERPGADSETLHITSAEAIEAYHDLRARTAAAGIVMADDVIAIEPTPQLREAIVTAVTTGAPDEE